MRRTEFVTTERTAHPHDTCYRKDSRWRFNAPVEGKNLATRKRNEGIPRFEDNLRARSATAAELP